MDEERTITLSFKDAELLLRVINQYGYEQWKGELKGQLHLLKQERRQAGRALSDALDK